MSFSRNLIIFSLLFLIAAIGVFFAGHVLSSLWRIPARLDHRAAFREPWARSCITTEDNHRLALYKRSSTSQPSFGTVIIVHGYRQTAADMIPYGDFFSGYDLVLFDCRGAGESSGYLTSLGVLEAHDVTAVARYLRERSLLPIIILGVSMGAAAVVRACGSDQTICDGLVLDSGYARLDQLLEARAARDYGKYSSYGVRIARFWYECFTGVSLSSQHFHAQEPASIIALINLPILLIHGTEDRVVPFVHAEALIAARNQSEQAAVTQVWHVQGGRHAKNYLTRAQTYQEQVSLFCSEAQRVFREKMMQSDQETEYTP